jgi:hypothetical protein
VGANPPAGRPSQPEEARPCHGRAFDAIWVSRVGSAFPCRTAARVAVRLGLPTATVIYADPRGLIHHSGLLIYINHGLHAQSVVYSVCRQLE